MSVVTSGTGEFPAFLIVVFQFWGVLEKLFKIRSVRLYSIYMQQEKNIYMG